MFSITQQARLVVLHCSVYRNNKTLSPLFTVQSPAHLQTPSSPEAVRTAEPLALGISYRLSLFILSFCFLVSLYLVLRCCCPSTLTLQGAVVSGCQAIIGNKNLLLINLSGKIKV